MTNCNVQLVACSDKPIDHPPCSSSQPYRAFFLVSFSSLVWFTTCNFTVLVQSHCSHQSCFQQQEDGFSEKASDNSTAHYLSSTKQQTDKVRD